MQSKKFGYLLLRKFILAIIFTGVQSAVYSQAGSTSKPDDYIAVKYLGSQEDMILVGIKYDNPDNEKFSLSIYNESGDVLFRNVYPTGKVDKKFQIPKEQGKLTFIFSASKQKLSRSYVIHNTTRTVEDVVVTKIN